MTMAGVETQLVGAFSVLACCNVKPSASADGQETVIPCCGMLEGLTESRYARAMDSDTLPPAVENPPPRIQVIAHHGQRIDTVVHPRT